MCRGNAGKLGIFARGRKINQKMTGSTNRIGASQRRNGCEPTTYE